MGFDNVTYSLPENANILDIFMHHKEQAGCDDQTAAMLTLAEIFREFSLHAAVSNGDRLFMTPPPATVKAKAKPTVRARRTRRAA